MHLPQLPASVFDPPPVACPGCHVALPDTTTSCPHCGYNGWTCVEKFPWIPPPLERYMDVDGQLTPGEIRRLDKVIERLEQSLPQVRIHVCIGRLHTGTDVREFGFWLFNASVPPDTEAASHRPWSVLLVIDRTAHSASLTIGYGLDPFLGDDQLTDCLQAAGPLFSKKRYGAGAAACLTKLHHALTQAQRNANRNANQLRRSLQDGTAPPDLVQDCRNLARRSGRTSH